MYYVSLYFVNANIWLILVTCGYILAIYVLTKQSLLSLWLGFIVTLSISKGKTLNFNLLPKADLASRNAVFDVGYILSFYLSDFVAGLLIWNLWKKLWWQKLLIKSVLKKSQIPRWQTLSLSFFWISFLIVALVPHFNSSLWPIIALSTLEICKLTLLFSIPSLLLISPEIARNKSSFNQNTAKVIAASILFQSGWAMLQYLTGGPLNRYIEAILPLGSSGQAIALGTMENWEILRVTGTFFDPSLLGTFLATTLIWLRQNQANLKPVWLFRLAMLSGTITIILTSNRILMFIILIWYYLELRNWLKTKTHLLKSLKQALFSKKTWLISGFLILIISWISPYLIARMTNLGQTFDKYGSATYRLQLGWYGIRLGLTNFWGVGLNLSPYFLATSFNQETVTFDPSHPHNIWLQLFAETGWLGMTLFLSSIYLIFRPLKKSGQTKFNWQMSSWGWGGIMFLICAQFYPVFINQIEVVSWLALMLGGHWAFRQNLFDKTTK